MKDDPQPESAPAYSPFTQSGEYRGTSVLYRDKAFTSSTGDKETDLSACRRWVRDFAFMPGGICDYGNPLKPETEQPRP